MCELCVSMRRDIHIPERHLQDSGRDVYQQNLSRTQALRILQNGGGPHKEVQILNIFKSSLY